MKNVKTGRTYAVAVTSALCAAVLVGCGGGTSSSDAAPGTGGDDLAQVQAESGVPEECLTAYPVAMTAPDLGDVELVPADWPGEPGGATLCQTTSTADGSIETVDFAATMPAAEVLDHYEAALADAGVVRADEGLGEQLSGSTGGVDFEITTRDGAYSVVFAAAG